jgi:hypothetical protein
VERLVLVAAIGGVMVAVLVRVFLARMHRHLEAAVELVPVQPRSVVHVLRTQEELEEAVRRAANFERRATDERRSRVDHYDALIAPNAIFHIRGDQESCLSDDQVHSA